MSDETNGISQILKQIEGSRSRWWEYYAVRYALGVGIGTPLIGLLWQQYRPLLQAPISLPSPFTSVIAAILWGAGGMAFCYVASVPMLTIHTARRTFQRTKPRVWILAAVFITIGAIGVALDIYCGSDKSILKYAAATALAINFLVQLALVCHTLYEPRKTYMLYDDLQENRHRRSDIVESYRHMREHGNSVSIVLAELLLAFCFWALKPNMQCEACVIARVALITGIWLLPSSLVWLVGSALERHVARWHEAKVHKEPSETAEPPKNN